MIIDYIGYYAGILMIFPGKEDFASVYNRMAVGESVNMTMQYNTFADQVGILEIILSLDIIANIISYDDPIGIAGKINMGEDIHAVKKYK